MIRRQYILEVALLLSLSSPAWATDVEQRCLELSANCVCAEAFSTNTFTFPDAGHANPSDSVTKQCRIDPGGPIGSVIERANATTTQGRNDTTALNALPAGHQVQYYTSWNTNHAGFLFAGHNHNSTTYLKRMAFRFYIWHTPDFEFFAGQSGGPDCFNAKLLQWSSSLLADHTTAPFHAYNWDTWTPAQDCCLSGPGSDSLTFDDWRGSWWRIESVMVNRSGGAAPNGWKGYVYARNITANGPELTLMDTTLPTGQTQLNFSDSRTPPSRMDIQQINLNRSVTSPNVCTGWNGILYYMLAGWDTDEGQRIGAASEIEGGEGELIKVKVTRIFDLLIGTLLTSVLVAAALLYWAGTSGQRPRYTLVRGT